MKKKHNNNGHGMGWLAKATSLSERFWRMSEWTIDRRLPERLDLTMPPFACANEEKLSDRCLRIEWPDDVAEVTININGQVVNPLDGIEREAKAASEPEEFWRPRQFPFLRSETGVAVSEDEESNK